MKLVKRLFSLREGITQLGKVFTSSEGDASDDKRAFSVRGVSRFTFSGTLSLSKLTLPKVIFSVTQP